MHAKLLCWMDRQPIELKGCAKHTELWHKEDVEGDGMNEDMLNQDGKHWWYLMKQSISKFKKEKAIMSKALAP